MTSVTNGLNEIISYVAIEYNVCSETIAQLNSHLIRHNYESKAVYWNNDRKHLVLMKNDPCYQSHSVVKNTSLYDLERQLNVCVEEFIIHTPYGQFEGFSRLARRDLIIYTRLDAPPCYDEQGRRLFYPDGIMVRRSHLICNITIMCASIAF